MDKNRRENSLFSCLFLYRSRKTDCFPVCYTKIDRKTDWLAMGIFPALFLSKTWPYNGFLEPCFLALRLGNIFLKLVVNRRSHNSRKLMHSLKECYKPLENRILSHATTVKVASTILECSVTWILKYSSFHVMLATCPQVGELESMKPFDNIVHVDNTSFGPRYIFHSLSSYNTTFHLY